MWKGLCQDNGPRLSFPLKVVGITDLDMSWDRTDFPGGLIEYPPVAAADGKPTVICLRWPTDIQKQNADMCLPKPQGDKAYFSKEWLIKQANTIGPYVEERARDCTVEGLQEVQLKKEYLHEFLTATNHMLLKPREAVVLN